jgi:uncharacterized coiled-coil protein SlyX
MWNPFRRHEEEHFNIDDALTVLSSAVIELQKSVEELREEVDYLLEVLDND